MTEDPNRALKSVCRAVEWRDLVRMDRVDGIVECMHPLPWLVSSWLCAAIGLWPAALTCSFLFFLTALRLNHEAVHHNLGFSARGHRLVKHALSMLMLGSNHAIAFNHLQHHAHLGRAEDVEGKCGRMTGWQVLLYGPCFPVELITAAWRRGGATVRRRMSIDAALNAGLVALAIGSGATFLIYHLAAMVVAQCLTAFFAVWTTHRGCHGKEDLLARTQRSRIINLFSYNMFFHLEHHLFPGVPVKRLPRLAVRLDTAAPELMAKARHVV